MTLDAKAPDPLCLPAFAALYAQARADQVIRAFSRRTNLVLAGTTTAVVGDGPVADALTTALTRIGSRVVRVAADPVVRLRARLAGLETTAQLSTTAGAHYIIATGESHPPLDPALDTALDTAAFAAVLADASPSGTALRSATGTPVRPHVDRAGETARVVSIPSPFPADLDEPPGLAWRIADLYLALSRLVADGGDPRAADLLIAEAVLS